MACCPSGLDLEPSDSSSLIFDRSEASLIEKVGGSLLRLEEGKAGNSSSSDRIYDTNDLRSVSDFKKYIMPSPPGM